jgi:hypothetical protein
MTTMNIETDAKTKWRTNVNGAVALLHATLAQRLGEQTLLFETAMRTGADADIKARGTTLCREYKFVYRALKEQLEDQMLWEVKTKCPKQVASAAKPFEKKWTMDDLRKSDPVLAARLAQQRILFDTTVTPGEIEMQGAAYCRGYQLAFEAMHNRS